MHQHDNDILRPASLIDLPVNTPDWPAERWYPLFFLYQAEWKKRGFLRTP